MRSRLRVQAQEEQVDAELEGYRRRFRSLIRRVSTALEGLSEEQLNWRPPAPDTNSACVIAAHTQGAVRGWVLGIACGQPVERDRPAEFVATGADAADLIASGERLADEIDAALGALTAADLDQRVLPDQSHWGPTEPQELTVREALERVGDHAATHVGHVELTRDLALQRG